MADPRLIQFADFDRPRGGSFVGMLVATARAARARGWQSEFAFFESAADAPWVEEIRTEGFPVHLAPAGLRSSDRGLARWAADVAAAGEGPVVVHSHFTGFDLATGLAARRDPRLRVIWHLHSPLPRTPWHVGRGLIKLGLLGRHVDAFLCPAQNIVDDAVARGAPRSRVHFFPSAIEPDAFPSATSADRAEARDVLGLEHDQIVLLHFGWHWRLKGGELFVQTLAQVAASEGGRVIGLERGGGEEYAALAERLGIADNLRIQEMTSIVRTLHAAADLQVASSLIEGMAYAVLESLCVGTAVVATEIPGHSFLAEHIDACRTARHDPDALAAAIATMLARSDEQRLAEAVQAREWISENLAIETVAERLVAFYEDLAADRPPSLHW